MKYLVTFVTRFPFYQFADCKALDSIDRRQLNDSRQFRIELKGRHHHTLDQYCPHNSGSCHTSLTLTGGAATAGIRSPQFRSLTVSVSTILQFLSLHCSILFASSSILEACSLLLATQSIWRERARRSSPNWGKLWSRAPSSWTSSETTRSGLKASGSLSRSLFVFLPTNFIFFCVRKILDLVGYHNYGSFLFKSWNLVLVLGLWDSFNSVRVRNEWIEDESKWGTISSGGPDMHYNMLYKDWRVCWIVGVVGL